MKYCHPLRWPCINGSLKKGSQYHSTLGYLEPEDHDEEAAGNGEDHVEEKVAVIAVADAVVEPRAVMVHLEHAAVAHRAVVSPRGLWVDAFLAYGHHLRKATGRNVTICECSE